MRPATLCAALVLLILLMIPIVINLFDVPHAFDASEVASESSSGAQIGGQGSEANDGVERVEVVRARVGATSSSDTGSLLLIACDARGVPLGGVQVALLTQQDRAYPWTDDIVDDLRSGRFANQVRLGRTDAAGRCLFEHIAPSPAYQLAVMTDGAFYFDAQPDPFVDMSSGVLGEQRKLYLDSKAIHRGLENRRTSGRIPVVSGETTMTRVTGYVGATVVGSIAGSDWDSAIVSLCRTARSVRRLEQRTLAVNGAFRFDGVALGGLIDIEAQLRRQHDIFFCMTQVALVDGCENPVLLEPHNPDDLVELRVDIGGEAGPGDMDIDVWIMLVQSVPSIKSDFIISSRHPVTVHGMRGAEVIACRVHNQKELNGWRLEPPKVEMLVNRRLVHDSHSISVSCSRIVAPTVRTVRLHAPRQMSYSMPVRLKFLSRSGALLGSARVAPGEGGVPVSLEWPRATEVRIQCDTPDAALANGSTRFAAISSVGGAVELHDPGPPNKSGVVLK